MDRRDLLSFLRTQRLAVVSTVSSDGAPQSAVVGIAITDHLEIVFDTLGSSRKARNLRADPRIAVVIGWDQTTVQIDGIADEPTGAERERILAAYFVPYPDGRDRLAWPGITHFRVRPTWARYTHYDAGETIVEFPADDLRSLTA
ncbi:MAG: pyridoxamine 5'-phosphate oxidase family protein [Planctomycetota bacterium]